MKRKNLLFVLPMVPYPLRAHGISVRYLPVLQHLGSKFDIDLVIVDNGYVSEKKIKPLAALCRNVFIIPNPQLQRHSLAKKMLLQFYLLLPWSPPNVSSIYGAGQLIRSIQGKVAGIQYESMIWVTFFYSCALSQVFNSLSCKRLVVDFIDSPTLCLKRRIISLRSPVLHHYDIWKMNRWEQLLIHKASKAIYISEDDCRGWPDGHGRDKLAFIPNGLNIHDYSSASASGIPSPNLGYLGNMGYEPNVEAVLRLYHEIYLPLRRRVKDLSLVIIGKNPPPVLKALAATDGVIITGAVNDIWPYINAVDIFVFPIQRGAGLKNKVIESMYAKRPVVTTTIGNEGINAVDGRDLFLCQDVEQFHKAIRLLLASSRKRQEVGEAARCFVTERFLWSNVLEKFEKAIVGEEERVQGERGEQAPTDTVSPLFSACARNASILEASPMVLPTVHPSFLPLTKNSGGRTIS